MKKSFMTANLNPQDVENLLRKCAADIVMPYHGALDPKHINTKGGNPNNLVTVADQKSEEFLTKELTKLLPGSVVVGEEAVEDDPSILKLLEDPNNAVWVIDPIDGTGNYARGDDTFCIIVALVEGGETKMGWIYDPVKDSMAFAQKGQGTTVDGRKMSVDQNADIGSEIGYIGSKILHQGNHGKIDTLRCSGQEYMRMAKGEAIFSVYGRTKPWDHLAGTLIVREAGGLAKRWNGDDYGPGDNTGGLISAANQTIWQKVRDDIPAHTVQRISPPKP